MRFTPGHRLGAYEIVSLLGVGGMGEVYRAVDTTGPRRCQLGVGADADGSRGSADPKMPSPSSEPLPSFT